MLNMGDIRKTNSLYTARNRRIKCYLKINENKFDIPVSMCESTHRFN